MGTGIITTSNFIDPKVLSPGAIFVYAKAFQSSGLTLTGIPTYSFCIVYGTYCTYGGSAAPPNIVGFTAGWTGTINAHGSLIVSSSTSTSVTFKPSDASGNDSDGLCYGLAAFYKI